MQFMQQQRKPKTFHVHYQTEHGKGCIMIYVGDFFGKNRLNDANAFLKFAKAHCTREQQLALLADLEEEKLLYRDTERERIEKTIKKIEAQTWGQNNRGNKGKTVKTGKTGKREKATRITQVTQVTHVTLTT